MAAPTARMDTHLEAPEACNLEELNECAPSSEDDHDSRIAGEDLGSDTDSSDSQDSEDDSELDVPTEADLTFLSPHAEDASTLEKATPPPPPSMTATRLTGRVAAMVSSAIECTERMATAQTAISRNECTAAILDPACGDRVVVPLPDDDRWFRARSTRELHEGLGEAND